MSRPPHQSGHVRKVPHAGFAAVQDDIEVVAVDTLPVSMCPDF